MQSMTAMLQLFVFIVHLIVDNQHKFLIMLCLRIDAESSTSALPCIL